MVRSRMEMTRLSSWVVFVVSAVDIVLLFGPTGGMRLCKPELLWAALMTIIRMVAVPLPGLLLYAAMTLRKPEDTRSFIIKNVVTAFFQLTTIVLSWSVLGWITEPLLAQAVSACIPWTSLLSFLWPYVPRHWLTGKSPSLLSSLTTGNVVLGYNAV